MTTEYTETINQTLQQIHQIQTNQIESSESSECSSSNSSESNESTQMNQITISNETRELQEMKRFELQETSELHNKLKMSESYKQQYNLTQQHSQSQKQYPTIGNPIDPNYNVTIPNRYKCVNRKENPYWDSYDQIFEEMFPNKKFEMKEIPGKGRGLICTSPIKKGELVFKEQASIFFEGKDENEDSDFDSTYYMTKSVYFGSAFCTVDFAVQLAQTPSRDEEFKPQVDLIYEELKNDEFLLYELKYDDVKRIVNGIHTNSFALDFIDGYAVFMACSLCNHSCRENLGWHTVGDYMYWVALEDIEVGTELTISYNFPDIQPSRIDYFEKYYGFTCDCVLCKTPIDIWRSFTCECGGIIYSDKDGWICHKCNRISKEDEIQEFIKEEERFKRMNKVQKRHHFKTQGKRMDDSHIYIIKMLRKYVCDPSCPNPLTIYEKHLLPVCKYHCEQSRGRLYASCLEQYGVSLLRFAQKYPHLSTSTKHKAEISFKMAYDYRCSLGMGSTGFAAREYLDLIELFDEDKLDKYSGFDEY